MFPVRKRGISKKIHDGILSMIDEGVESKTSINESVDIKFTELRDIEEFLSGKELPYLKIGDSNRLSGGTNSEMTLVVGVGPANDLKSSSGYSILFTFDVSTKEDAGLLVDTKKVVPNIDATDFLDDYSRNPKADPNQFNDIVASSDVDRFFISYKKSALDLVAKRFDLVRSIFDLIDVKRDPNGTLGVWYDKRKKRFELIYNPSFVLLSTLEEWALNGKTTHETLVDCYIFTLGFLLAHEMSHIIGHDTESSMGSLDVNSIHHYFDNVFQDSYINVMLGNILKGVTGTYDNKPLLLSNGIGRGYSVRSSRGGGGFKTFKSLKDISQTLAEIVSKTTKIPIESVKDSGGVSSVVNSALTNLAGGVVFLRLFCDGSSPNFRSSNLVFVSTANSLIKALVDGDILPANAGLTDEEKKTLKVEKRAEGLLVGAKVMDKKTKKLGVVVEDSGYGIRVVYPDDPTLIDTISKQVLENKNAQGGVV
jgi:hypothetical protein